MSENHKRPDLLKLHAAKSTQRHVKNILRKTYNKIEQGKMTGHQLGATIRLVDAVLETSRLEIASRVALLPVLDKDSDLQ